MCEFYYLTNKRLAMTVAEMSVKMLGKKRLITDNRINRSQFNNVDTTIHNVNANHSFEVRIREKKLVLSNDFNFQIVCINHWNYVIW